jgi:hypothetical protein
MLMDLQELNLPAREERILESMGFSSLEKIAVCHRDELGLGRARGDAIIQRARNMLVSRNVQQVSVSEDRVAITLGDLSEPVLISLRAILGAVDGIEEKIDGNRLTISKPVRKACSECGKDGTYLCTACGAGLCDICRYSHKHQYKAVLGEHLLNTFEAAKQKAQRLEPALSRTGATADDRSREEVITAARNLGFAGFVASFFAELEGNEVMKKALSCALFSTWVEPVHVLVIGDPAGGKTLAKDIIARKLGTEVELVGANTTRSGLVCNLATGEPGALTQSDGKVVLVDEFDKIPSQDVEYCLELLSNGKCTIHSARIHETVESHFIMIAFANPVETVFMKDPIKEIGLPPVLLSRFAFIVKAEVLDAARRKALLKRKLLGEALVSEHVKWLQPWLSEARKYSPKFEVSETEIDDYLEKVNSLIEAHMRTPLRRDMRMGDYAKRIPFAVARASFSNVDSRILKEATLLIEESVAAW